MRTYIPEWGCFTSQDMKTDVFDSMGMGSYGFPYNNPLIYTDPTGLDGEISEYFHQLRDNTKDAFLVGSLNDVFYGTLAAVFDPVNFASAVADDFKAGNTGKRLKGSLLGVQNTATMGLGDYYISATGQWSIYSDPIVSESHRDAQAGAEGAGLVDLSKAGAELLTNKALLNSLNLQISKGAGSLDDAAQMSKNTKAFDAHNDGYYGSNIDGVVGESVTATKVQKKQTLIHYTDEAGEAGILNSNQLNLSTGIRNARHGDGQYFTDINPSQVGANKLSNLTQAQIDAGHISSGQLSSKLFGVPWNQRKVSNFVEIDVTGLPIQNPKPGVFLIPNDQPLDLTNRIINSGTTLGK